MAFGWPIMIAAGSCDLTTISTKTLERWTRETKTELFRRFYLFNRDLFGRSRTYECVVTIINKVPHILASIFFLNGRIARSHDIV